jgi:hypothetical protein
MATLHERWKAEKTSAEANFKLARTTLFNRIAKQAKEGSEAAQREAKAKATQLQLMASGLDGGGTNYMAFPAFAAGLGDKLDRWEKAKAKIDAARQQFRTLKAEEILRDKNLTAGFASFCKQPTQAPENWKFYTEGQKRKPAEVYRQYVNQQSPDALGFFQSGNGHVLNEKWKACHTGNAWNRDGSQLVRETLKLVLSEFEVETLKKLRGNLEELEKVVKAAVGAKTFDEEKRYRQEAHAVIDQYKRTLEKYRKYWGDLRSNPEFWTGPLGVLAEIATALGPRG